MGIKELINAFNLNNYACDKISTNFTIEGKKIVGLFASSTNIGEYLQRMEEKIIKRHYGTREIASEFYNFNCFPFVLGANPNKGYLDNGIVKVKLADSTNNEVICNLKVHFANEFKRAVEAKVVARLQKARVTEDEAYEWIEETVGTGAIGKPYLYCIAFSDEYLKREYDSETFEFFKQAYIEEFNSRLENCDLKSSDFYEYKNDMLYIKNIGDKVVRSVAEYVKGRVALYLGTPGTEDSKVENFKDVLGDFIFKWTGKSINAYEYDIFTDKKKIENGNDFVLIPLTKRYSGQLESLKHKDVYRINIKYKNLMSDIRGKTAKSDVASYENPVYAISNKRIAQLLPEIMQSPIAYNQINGCFEFAVDLENFKRRGSSRSSSTVTSPFNSPTHAEPPRTPPEQTGARFFESEGDRDSGIGDSPPKPKDSGSSSGGPGPSTALSYMELESPTRSQDEELERFPRQGSGKEKEGLLYCCVNPDGTSKEFSPSPQLNSIAVSYGVSGPSSSVQSVSAAKNVRAGTSAWSQPMDRWSLLVFYAQSSNISVPRFQLPTQLSSSGSSLWKDAAKNVQAGTSQPMNPWSSSAPSAGLSLQQRSRPLSWQGASERRTSDKPLTEEEKELFKELLYTLNLTNYAFDGVYTNFFAKGEKIVSLLHDNVDREKYLQEVKASIIEKYCETEEEARELYDLDEFPFKLNCEEKQGKTVVANISSGALSNLKILFSRKFKKDVNAIDISVVKEVEKHEKEKWVGLQLKGCTFTTEEDIKEDIKLAYTSCFPDEGAMKIIPIAFDEEEGEYVLDRSRDRSEVRLLRKALPPLTTKEEVQRFLDHVFKTGKTQQELSQEEKELFKALLYAFNYSNNNFDRPDTNFIVKNGKIVSLINDDVDVKEYLKEVRGETIKEYCVNEKEAYDLNEFPFKFLSNCEKKQETTVVANISRSALFNLEKLFIYSYKEEVKIEKIDIKTVKKAVESEKCRLVELKVKGIEREARYRARIKRREAVTASYPDEDALEDISIKKYEAGYRLHRTFDDWEAESFAKQYCAEGTSVAGKVKPEDNKDSGISSGEATDAENVSSEAKATISGSSGYESVDCENTRGGSPKRTLELSMGIEELAISTGLDATKVEQHSPIKKFRSN